MKVLGFVPARMASTRFPGKPLFKICGRPMIEHVFERAKMFERWDGLFVATCDTEIASLGREKGYPTIMTSPDHTRCLDRVAEATEKCGERVEDDAIIVCVQGDEPMLDPAMIDAAIKPLEEDPQTSCSVLAMHIVDNEQFLNTDIVKIVHDVKGRVLYTSRAPVPYCKTFTPELNARRIYGIFAFRWAFLKWFNEQPESPLELAESCDSNRICDYGGGQAIAPYPYQPSFSVDSPADAEKVENAMAEDRLWGRY